jgi:hypothetical protein
MADLSLERMKSEAPRVLKVKTGTKGIRYWTK